MNRTLCRAFGSSCTLVDPTTGAEYQFTGIVTRKQERNRHSSSDPLEAASVGPTCEIIRADLPVTPAEGWLIVTPPPPNVTGPNERYEIQGEPEYSDDGNLVCRMVRR